MIRQIGMGRRLITAKRALGEPVEHQVDHWRREQRQNLAHQQATDDADAQRMAQLGADAGDLFVV